MIIRKLGICSWELVVNKMYKFTHERNFFTEDELWLVEHPKIFTIGKSYAKKKYPVKIHNIPVAIADRGGKITYHAPGQQIIYILVNLKKLKLTVKNFVMIIEQSIINTLKYFDIISHRIFSLPGVYIKNKKISFLGLRISNYCSYHGCALNVSMDLSPFLYINPCGHKNLKITQISHFIPEITISIVEPIIIRNFINLLY